MTYPDPTYFGDSGEVSARLRRSDKPADIRYPSGTTVDYLYVPEGGLHGFGNESGEPATMLILFSSGAPREDYFEGLLRMRTGLVMTDEEKDAFYVAHDNIYV